MQINPLSEKSYISNTNRNSNLAKDGFLNSMKTAADNPSGYKVYLKKDDMLYSGGNGTGLSFYLKYAEDSTEDDPRILAKGIDENGNEFEQTISV